MAFTVPFGRNEISFELPGGMTGLVAESNHIPPLPNLAAAVESALAGPVDSPPLRDLARPGQKVCLVFTDATRNSPDKVLVPAMLRELEAAGVRDGDVTLLCGLGMHRPSTHEERLEKLGSEILARYKLIDNEPRNPESLVDLGTSESGIPLSVNRTAYEADLVLATGVVEPHQYAGYSGGRKTLAVGAGGEAMIEYTHGPRMIDHPGTRLGRIQGNPFHQAISEAARRAGLSFILNVVQDDQGRPVSVAAGNPEKAFAQLVESAQALYEAPVPRQFDLAVAGVGRPKDANIYQACRAASYLFFAPVSVVRDGGVIIIPAPTPEGAGQGVGEQRFLEKMQGARDMKSLLDELRRTGYPPGAQRAFVMAKVLEKVSVIIAGTQTPDLVKACKMIPAGDMDEALDQAVKIIGKSDLDALIVPHALLTLPIVG